jgi:hypothetical protein
MLGKGIIVDVVRLALPADLDRVRWDEIGTNLGHLERAVAWWVGDWWAFGEHRHGARRQITEQPGWQGPAYQTCANAAAVCRAFEFSRRREALSFSHHEAVAALAPMEQDRLLDEAEQEGWSRQQLRYVVRSTKRSVRAALRSIDTPTACSIIPPTAKAADRVTTAAVSEAASSPINYGSPSDPCVSAVLRDPPPLTDPDTIYGSARQAETELAQFLDRFENSYRAIRGFVTVIERMREARAMLSSIVSQLDGSFPARGAALIILTSASAATEDRGDRGEAHSID